MSEDRLYSAVFLKVGELCYSLGLRNIKDQPGCAEHKIDEQWWFAINPHDEPAECSTGTTVPPLSVYFQFNGWPFGVVGPGGGMMGAGAAANEEKLLLALDHAIAELGGIAD